MTDEEIKERWLAYELWHFVMSYLFVYGEKYCNNPLNAWQIKRNFIRQWEKKSQEEKQARFNKFFKILKQCEEVGEAE